MLASTCVKLRAASPLHVSSPRMQCSIREMNGELGMPVVATLPTLSRQQTPLAVQAG